MKIFRILGRNIRDAIKSVFRNFSLSLASISSITITLLVVAITIILTYNVNSFAEEVKRDVTIVAFLDSEVTDERVNEIEELIKNTENVDSYLFNSKFDITDDFINSSETYKNIMSNWGDDENPIQHTYLIKVKDIEQISVVAESIKEFQDITAVKYGEGMVESLIKVFNMIEKISLAVVIALMVVTAFLITNTIKITIFARMREIEIMRLVGASNINIKLPFIFEGLFLGVIGSIIPIFATMYGYTVLVSNFDGQVYSHIIKLVKPYPFLYYISGILLAMGMFVGMYGSWRASRKYLKI